MIVCHVINPFASVYMRRNAVSLVFLPHLYTRLLASRPNILPFYAGYACLDTSMAFNQFQASGELERYI